VRLSRRLSPERVTDIVAKYEAGATTPALRAEYGLSKGGLLKVLGERGVEMRRTVCVAIAAGRSGTGPLIVSGVSDVEGEAEFDVAGRPTGDAPVLQRRLMQDDEDV
jgi:hypothetical protein